MWDPFRCSHVDMARQEVTFFVTWVRVQRPFNSHIAAPCQVMTRPGRGRVVWTCCATAWEKGNIEGRELPNTKGLQAKGFYCAVLILVGQKVMALEQTAHSSTLVDFLFFSKREAPMVGKWRSWSVAGTTLLAACTRTRGHLESSCGLGATACGARKSGSASSCQNLSVGKLYFFQCVFGICNKHSFSERLAKIWANAEVSRYPPGVVLQAYSPGARVQIAVVQRQVSSPNLSPKPTSFVVPAPSPGRPVSAMSRMNVELNTD